MNMDKNKHNKHLTEDPTDPKWLLRQAVLASLKGTARSCLEVIDEIYRSTGGWKPSPELINPLLLDLKDNAYVQELPAKSGVSRYKLTKTGKALLVEQTEIIKEFIEKTIKEIPLAKGFKVLDFACGPGRYVVAVSKAIGLKGKLYALDAAPAALELVRKTVDANKLSNVETVESSCYTGLPGGELDAVLLYDAFHGFNDPMAILSELHRVLKPRGVLSFSDIHMEEKEIVSRITSDGLFKLKSKNQLTYTFEKILFG
jgi:ubiquinone/menaquinone biosynthesis C-methylase UbiE